MRSTQAGFAGRKSPHVHRSRRNPRRDSSLRSLRSEPSFDIDQLRAPSFYGGKGAKELAKRLWSEQSKQGRGKGKSGRKGVGDWAWPPEEPRFAHGEEKGVWGLTAYHDWLQSELQRVQSMLKRQGKPFVDRHDKEKRDTFSVPKDKGQFATMKYSAKGRIPKTNEFAPARRPPGGNNRHAEALWRDEPGCRGYSLYPEPYKGGFKGRPQDKGRQDGMYWSGWSSSEEASSSNRSPRDMWSRGRENDKMRYTWDKPTRTDQASIGSRKSTASRTSSAHAARKEHKTKGGKPGSLQSGARGSKGSPSRKGDKTRSTMHEAAPVGDSGSSFSSRGSSAYQGRQVGTPTSGRRRSPRDASQRRRSLSKESEKGEWVWKGSTGRQSSPTGDPSKRVWPLNASADAFSAPKGKRKRKEKGKNVEAHSSDEVAADDPSQDNISLDTSADLSADSPKEPRVQKVVYVF